MGFFSNLFGGGKSSAPSYQKIEIPPFWDDPYVAKTQDYLYGFGTDILSGKLPDPYSSIMDFDSKEFEDMLSLKNRDILSGVNESAAKRGIGRSGVTASAAAKAISDSSTTARYGNYENTISNLKSLLTTGLNTVGGVGNNALTNQSQKNNYQLGKAELEIDQNKFAYGADMDAYTINSAKEESGFQLEDLIGGAGNIFGDLFGGGGESDGLNGAISSLFGGQKSGQGSAEVDGEKTEFYKDPKFYTDIAQLALMFA